MFSAEWFSAAAIDWLSPATPMRRDWIVGDSAEVTAPSAKTNTPRVTIQAAVSASSDCTTMNSTNPPRRVRFRSMSARWPPTRLPIVIPRPMSTSTIGTAHSGAPATSVTTGAM